MHNIEKSAFRRNEYVGYAHGVWHISHSNGGWTAIHTDGVSGPFGKHCLFSAPTLRDVSIRLENMEAQHDQI